MRLIDADTLLTAIQKKEAEPSYQHTGEDWCVGLIIAEGLVDEQPTIEPQKWVSCSERLPEESGSYLCTCLDGHRSMVTQVKFHPRIKSWNLTGARAYWKVIAWQPLPEPFDKDINVTNKGEEE